MSSQPRSDIEAELRRIGIRPADRLPMPRDLKSDSDYLVFLRQVPDASGIRGFAATMAQRAKHP